MSIPVENFYVGILLFAWKQGKVVPIHAVKACGSRGIAPLILNLGTSWRWAFGVTLPPHYPRESE